MALSDYAGRHPIYHYYADDSVPLDKKMEALREYLLLYKEDHDFEEKRDGNEHNWYNALVATTTEGLPKFLLKLPQNRDANTEEVKAFEFVWVDVLELSCNLKDTWKGSGYTVFKRRTLDCKKMVLEQFVKEYGDWDIDINPTFNGNTSFRALANTDRGKTELIINYFPERVGEAVALERAFKEFKSAKS